MVPKHSLSPLGYLLYLAGSFFCGRRANQRRFLWRKHAGAPTFLSLGHDNRRNYRSHHICPLHRAEYSPCPGSASGSLRHERAPSSRSAGSAQSFRHAHHHAVRGPMVFADRRSGVARCGKPVATLCHHPDFRILFCLIFDILHGDSLVQRQLQGKDRHGIFCRSHIHLLLGYRLRDVEL